MKGNTSNRKSQYNQHTSELTFECVGPEALLDDEEDIDEGVPFSEGANIMLSLGIIEDADNPFMDYDVPHDQQDDLQFFERLEAENQASTKIAEPTSYDLFKVKSSETMKAER